jgi:tRNA (guanosine-2'-O-)-methyltransferase
VRAVSRFPHSEFFDVGGIQFHSEEIIEKLDPQISSERREKINQVIDGRTYTVVPVMDGLIDYGNINAVIRSAESFGFQKMNVIQGTGQFKAANRVSQGADKWLDIDVYEKPEECIQMLKRQGYKICATYLGERSQPISDIDFTQPTALVFGNEHRGISEEIKDSADEFGILPMQGFSQSFNISVAAALMLMKVKELREQKQGFHGDLDEHERLILRASYYLKAIKNSERILTNLIEGTGLASM